MVYILPLLLKDFVSSPKSACFYLISENYPKCLISILLENAFVCITKAKLSKAY